MLERKPRIRNKYGLKVSDINRIFVKDWDRLKELCYYNPNFEAWTISMNTIRTEKDILNRTYNRFDLKFFDKNASKYSNKVLLDCKLSNGEKYDFKSFYNEKDISEDIDLVIQEKLLNVLNTLISEQIISIQKCNFKNTRRKQYN